jgi:cell division septation protein DedD
MIRRLSIGAMLFIIGAILGCRQPGAKRLPESGFQVAFESHKIASEMTSGKTVSADITVKNVSPVTWPSKPDKKDRYAVNLSYHWLNQKGAPVVFEGLRTPLPRDLKPGDSVKLNATIQAPAKPGKYTLEVTLVQEQAAWFPDKKCAKLVLPVTVSVGSESAAITQRYEKTAKPQTQAADAGKTPLKKDMAGQTTAKTYKPAGSVERSDGAWSVQLDSYAEKKVATNLAKKLRDKGYDAYVTIIAVKGRELPRVRVGRLAQRAEAEKLRDTLRTAEKLERAVVTSR